MQLDLPLKDRPTFIYVSGPYAEGDTEQNVRDALDAAQALVDNGFVPFVPHLFHFWDAQIPGDADQWMRLDFEWLLKCDAVVRLPGSDLGADREVIFARAHAVDVYDGIDNFLIEAFERRWARAST
tara:strand:- start:9748 stop:10125 length:378 start_codon:yes stop_codon:yes gene_type:complete